MHTAYKHPMAGAAPSGCPLHLALEILGDRWSLLIIRDMAFNARRTFGELLEHNPERIASNILANRLTRLEKAQVIRRTPHPADHRKSILQLQPAGIALVTVIKELGEWGVTYLKCDPAMSIRIIELVHGGPKFLRAYQHELVAAHARAPKRELYGALAPAPRGVIAQALNAAHLAAVAVLREWPT